MSNIPFINIKTLVSPIKLPSRYMFSTQKRSSGSALLNVPIFDIQTWILTRLNQVLTPYGRVGKFLCKGTDYETAKHSKFSFCELSFLFSLEFLSTWPSPRLRPPPGLGHQRAGRRVRRSRCRCGAQRAAGPAGGRTVRGHHVPRAHRHPTRRPPPDTHRSRRRRK